MLCVLGRMGVWRIAARSSGFKRRWRECGRAAHSIVVIRKDVIRKDVIRKDVIRKSVARSLTAILAAALAWGADAPSILTIRVADGDGAAYPVGSRATRGLTVLVTDETGRPVEGATVSFTLPAEGPGGVFSTGGRTEIAATRGDGRAGVWGMQWNRTAGPFEIRITAVKGQARAGVVSSQSLSSASEVSEAAPKKIRAGWGSHKILWISLVVAGAAAVGVAGIAARTPSASTAASSVTPLKIGTPTISLGAQ
jgi:hypothetical protein